MNTEQLTEDGQAMRRLMGDGISADGIAAALDCHLQKVRAIIDERPTAGGQVWGTREDIMRLYGLKAARAAALLRKVQEGGKVRMQRPSGADKRGTYYHLGDIEKAWSYEPLPAANK